MCVCVCVWYEKVIFTISHDCLSMLPLPSPLSTLRLLRVVLYKDIPRDLVIPLLMILWSGKSALAFLYFSLKSSISWCICWFISIYFPIKAQDSFKGNMDNCCVNLLLSFSRKIMREYCYANVLLNATNSTSIGLNLSTSTFKG